MNRLNARTALLCVGVLLCLGCEREPGADASLGEAPASVRAPRPEPVPTLEPEFLERGLSALKKAVGEQVLILELRAEGRCLSLQVELGGKLEQVDYIERDGRGEVVGPDRVRLQGGGPLEANLFSLAEIELAGIGRAFRIATKAVDPLDGRVTKIVVRRFLPFTEKVRTRIYVDSPRMSGSIDTNERGVPLKRR